MDNTLWGGVVEDGYEGIKLDPNGSGAPFIRLQSYLKLLQQNRFTLGVTKNNEADVLDVFQIVTR